MPAHCLTVSFLTSTQLTETAVQRLHRELAGGPQNEFVCLLLATMAKEQLAATASAAAEGRVFALLEAGGLLVAAALLHCRSRSLPKHGMQAAAAEQTGSESRCTDPHAFITLMCTNQPGMGFGTLLLQHIEAHTKRHAAGSLAVGGCPLQSIKLLSVETSQRFYTSNGYSGPDADTREMHKLLTHVN